MKKRIAYISLYFFTVLLIFILQKPLFMLYNGSIEKGFGFADYMQVMIHGASLDAATAGYLTAFPFLLVLISIWFRKFPLKKILYGYYILATALISIIFVVDMALYTFIIRKTKCFDFWERNVLFPKTKRSFFRTPKHPLPCPFPLNFSLLIITKKFGNLAKNRYICIV